MEDFYAAVVTGVVIGMILVVPLLVLLGSVKILIKVIARSKLSLDDYLKLANRDDLF